jgi:FkbM family methyltransferase
MKNYIQIGANIGYDNFFEIIQKLETKSNVFLIEPNSNLIEKLTECYKCLRQKHNIIIINAGIVHDLEVCKLYVPQPPYTDMHSSVINRHGINNDNVANCIEFKPIKLNDFFVDNNISEVELLSIDTEGYDYTILDSINLDNIIIRNIECEYWSYDNNDINDLIKIRPSTFSKIQKKFSNIYNITEDTRDGMLTHIFTFKTT